jgi:apolipoprotein N-acyltransferase
LKLSTLWLWPTLALLLGVTGPVLWYQFGQPWLLAAGFAVLFYAVSHRSLKYCLLLAACFGIPASYQTLDWLFDFNRQFGGEAMGGISLVYSVIVFLQFIYTPFAPLATSYFLVRTLKIGSVWWVAPIVFTLFEAWRSRVMTGFTLGQPSYWLLDTPFANLAPVFGALGLTLASYLLIGCLVTLIAPEKALARGRSALAVGVLFLSCFALSGVNWSEPQPSKNVRIVHDAAGLEFKDSPRGTRQRLDLLMAQTTASQVQNESIDLVLWPEGSISSGRSLFNQVLSYAKQLEQVGAKLLLGAYTMQGRNEYNAILSGSTLKSVYNKRHLIPFGEYVPDHPLLVNLAGDSLSTLAHSQLKKGAEYQPTINVGGLQLRALICFEIMFGYDLARQLGDFDALVYFSDLSWVRDTLLPDQSLLMARMRAIEFAKPVVSASNLGFSGYIDAKGNVLALTKSRQRQVLDVQLVGQRGVTPYAKFVDHPLIVLLLASIVLPVLVALRRKFALAQNKVENSYEH